MTEGNETMTSAKKWRKGKRLGSGTFGLVVLWENEETGMTLALKHYKGSMDMKNCDRWVKEVAIMKTLKHSNIVRAFEVPDQLKDSSSHLPVLAMEYCSGGDLRQVFSRAESCYGFTQLKVKTVLSQICDGLYYLHKNDIIHRDLKPENIVLKPIPDSSTFVYKIIDLGYAKDIGHGSIPQSFAGTLQYAAPDLLQKRPYSKSVDYWSLGILCFEMIVGRRPFSPVDNDPVVTWYNSITNRPDNCICFNEDLSGKVTFSETLPVNNNISRNFKLYFEFWLRHMLLLDPDKRGKAGPKEGEYGAAPWYGMVREIIATKEYRVLDVTHNRLLVYHNKATKTVTDLHNQLAQADEANIPIEDQELLLPTGKIAMQTDPPTNRPDDTELETLPDYFLFCKPNKGSGYDLELKLTPLPVMAAKLADDPKTVVTSARIRLRSWAECLYYCRVMVREAVDILEGIRTMKMAYMRQFKEMAEVRRKLSAAYTKLQGKHDFFKASIEEDLKSYTVQKEVGIKSDRMYAAWLDSQKQFQEMPAELERCYLELCTRADGLGKSMFEIKEYPKKTSHQDKLDENKHYSEKIFSKLRKDLKERPPKDVDCTQLVQTMKISIQEREKLGEEAAKQLRELLTSRDNAVNLRLEMEGLMQRLAQHDSSMMITQRHRQQMMWTSLGYCMENYKRERNSNRRTDQLRQREEPALDAAGPSTLTGPSTLAGPSTLTGPSTLAGPSTLTGPGTLAGPETLGGPNTLTEHRMYMGQTSINRDFTSMTHESLRTVEHSLSVSGEFQSQVDRYNNESSARLDELNQLDWEFE